MSIDITLNWNPWMDLAVLGIDALCATLLYAIYRKKERLIQNILSAPSLSVSSELEELLQGKENYPYVVVRGRVKELGQTIESSSGLQTVMQRVTLNEHSYRRSAFNSWGDNVRTIHQAHNAVPFALRNILEGERSSAKSSKFVVQIDNPFDADDESLFLTNSTNFTPSNTSVASTVMGFFTGVAVRGVERTEEVLPVNTVITGIGRLVKDASTGRVKLVTPKDEDQYRFILSTLPVESIVKRLEGRNTVLKIAICVVVSVGAVIAVRRLRIIWRERQMQRMRDAILRERSRVNIEELESYQTCTVCLTNPREVILLNCGHVCVCADCCLKINSKCPVCRQAVISTHPAYIA